MKRRWKILIAAGISLVLLGASAWVTMHVQPANEVEAYKKYLRARGEKLDISKVLPPPVAPEDNSVNAVEEAFGKFGSSDEKIPYAMQMVAPGKALIGWMQPEARGFYFTNSWDEFAANVKAERPAIELLHQVLERPKLDFKLDYSKGTMMPLTHLAPMKRATQKLCIAAIYDLHSGDNGAAETNILTLLALVHRDTRDQLLISHLVRIAMTAIAVAPTWELLQATNATEAQLAAVQNGWQQLDFLSDAEKSFVMERMWTSAEIRRFRVSHESWAAISGGSSSASGGGQGWQPDWEAITEDPRKAVGEVMWRSSWSYSEELCRLKADQIILETVRSMQTNQGRFYRADYDAMVSRLSSLGITNAGQALFDALEIPDFHEVFGDWGLNTVIRKTLMMEVGRDVVVTAIALKRFQFKHGKWPETLAELTPDFLPSVPIDPNDGRPLKYHPNADGTYRLYSVGEDGMDDGGDPTNTASGSSSLYWLNAKARDWVWPQPASPAEVQHFYEHPPK